MALIPTNLVISSAPLPATFTGTPDDLRKEIVKRMKILSPSGINFIYIGDTEPTSDVGPWLKDGNKWYVFDEDIKRYVPIDVSDSVDDEIQISESTPATSTPAIWLRTIGGAPVGFYFFNGSQWVPGMNIVQSGPTANRPASPFTGQQYYDTDISVLIWWERGQWRTLSGSPGDVKFVVTELLSTALAQNPGWEVLGASQQSWRGRYISQATQDAEQSLSVSAGIAQRNSRETFGETDGVQIAVSAVPYPPTIALWCLVKL